MMAVGILATQIIVYGLGAALLNFILLSIYRLTFHPLAKYPGPISSKITSLSIYLQATTGDRHLNQLHEHQKYGPIVRIAPNQLSFAEPSALRSIYQSGRANNPLRKAPFYETLDAPSGAYSTHTEISRKKHAFRRRVLEVAFSDSSLRSLEPFVTGNVNILLSLLSSSKDSCDSGWSKPKNMSDLATWFAYDVMGDLVFGERFNCLTSSDHRFVPRLLMTSSGFIYPVANMPLQWLVRPIICSPMLMNCFGGQTARDEHAYVEYANACVASRIASSKSKPEERKDVMYHMLNARTPMSNQPFSKEELDAESSLLIAAGADTTSTTLAAAMFYLTLPNSKQYLEDLTQQLRGSFETLESISGSRVVTQPLLRAVVDETLRLSPSVPTHLPRIIVEKPGITIAGNFVPAGTVVGCAAYVLHRDHAAYPQAEEFRPERWIASDRSSKSSLQHPNQVALAKEAFCAFSLGSRGCVGKSLAYMELSIALGRLLWAKDVRRAVGTDNVTARTVEDGAAKGWSIRKNEYQLKDRFLAEREGPMVEFRPR